MVREFAPGGKLASQPERCSVKEPQPPPATRNRVSLKMPSYYVKVFMLSANFLFFRYNINKKPLKSHRDHNFPTAGKENVVSNVRWFKNHTEHFLLAKE